ncbi:hypothetical protein A1O3_03588, partial [Capronia epimyces CBS 606.96]
MIRLPPSSISLSESDVEFHLRQAEIYHGLLRQGFEKHDIVRYLKDHRKAISEAAGGGLDGELLFASSTVQLAYRRSPNSSQDEALQQGESAQSSQSNFQWESAERSTRHSTRLSTNSTEQTDESDVSELPQSEGRSVSPVSLVPAMQVNKHAPRKSSLLRFATAASRESSPTDTAEADDIPVPIVSSNTASEWDRSSGFEEPYDHSCLPDWVVEEMRQISLNSTDAQRGSISGLSDDMPLPLPPPFSATPRIYSSQDFGAASPVGRQSLGDASQGQYESASLLPMWTHRRSYTEGTIEELPSSPPVPSASPVEEISQVDEPSTSSGLPATPTPIRRAPAFPRTEPQSHRHRYLDGNSFSVYNESLPATSQPQTPADLARRPYITEHNAAYTAPPGRVRVGSASTSNVDGQRWDPDAGEPSPTVRAISLRERRNRELQRSVRVDGMRLRRMMMRDETLFTQRAVEAPHPGGDVGRARNRPGLFQAMLDDLWRDDLDADRVGEENFEGDAEVNRRGTMRVVSGNARFEG